MEFQEFEKQISEAVKEAQKNLTPKDCTIHLRRALNGEISVVYGAVSPEYASPGVIYSRHCFSIRDYEKGNVDLEEYFRYMMDDINEELEYMKMGE